MKTSELIILLQEAMDKHGDLELQNDDSLDEGEELTFELTPFRRLGEKSYPEEENPDSLFVDALLKY